MKCAQGQNKNVFNDRLVVSEISSIADTPLKKAVSPTMFTLIIVVSGSISLSIDKQQYVVGAGTVVHTGSERMLKLNSYSEDFCGRIISLDRDLANTIIPGFTPGTYLYMYQNPMLQLTNDEMAEILAIFAVLKNRSEKSDQKEGKVFNCLFMALYFQMMEYIEKRVHKNSQPLLSHKETLYKRFLTLLKENVRKEHRVTFYANRLCLTPQYISFVLKEISGKTANKWIDEMLLAEAKMLLFSTENNIQQIADQLHFPDQSSFGKFFKKMTGFSPSNYKKSRID